MNVYNFDLSIKINIVKKTKLWNAPYHYHLEKTEDKQRWRLF